MKTKTTFEFDLGEILFDAVPSLEASEEGELMRFRNAILARAEVNKNKDGLTEENIVELATTLPLMPINMEHEGKHVVGFFTAARADAGALVVDGVIFARHFPDVVKDILSNVLKLSIEGMAAAVKMADGVRWFEGLKAIGGGLTRKPAGSNTGFQNSSLLMIASEIETEEEMERVQELEATVAELRNQIAQMEAEKTEKDTAIQAAQESLQAAEAAVEQAKADAQAEIEGVKASERLSASRAAVLLASGVAEETVNDMWAELGTVSAKMFEMIASNLQKQEAEQPEVDEPAPDIVASTGDVGDHEPNEIVFEFV